MRALSLPRSMRLKIACLAPCQVPLAIEGEHTIPTKIFTDRLKNTGDFWNVGNFYRCRLQIPRNFGSVILANLPTRDPLCLLNNAKAPVGMTDLKIKGIFWGIGNFYRYRLQILANLSGKHIGWNGTRIGRKVGLSGVIRANWPDAL